MSARYLVTGGCGFIGSNMASALLRDGNSVVVLDNLSRLGTERNLEWLQSLGSKGLEFVCADVRDSQALEELLKRERFDAVFHYAAQVAVTTSVTDPRTDFDINALGAFNLLEAVRLSGRKTPVMFTSTNKVYGGMEDVKIEDRGGRYEYADLPHGVSEDRCLDFHSPYGCSKGTADQYFHDYSRIYGLPTVVFRMSCQYGPRQFGNEDQGWVAHFVIAAHKGRPISIFGDGKQVRDVLFVDDLIAAFRTALGAIDKCGGRIYNIGGGPQNTMSLLELLALLERETGHSIPVTFGDWRPGDQPVYVSDIRRAYKDFGWKPTISKEAGVRKLLEWVRANESIFS